MPKKQTHRQRGYVEPKEALAFLDGVMDRIHNVSDSQLVKISLQIWLASEDEPERRQQRAAMDAAYNASPEELGEAAVWMVRQKQLQHSAMMCEHANEVPARCPCDADCYCKTHTCAHRK